MGVIMPIYTIGIIIFFLYTTMKIMFKNKNEEEPNASYNRKFYGDANKYDEDYYNNYIKQYQAAQNMRPGSGPSGAEVEEVETCMQEVTEDTTSSVSMEEVEEKEATSSTAEVETEGKRTAPPAPPTSATKPA